MHSREGSAHTQHICCFRNSWESAEVAPIGRGVDINIILSSPPVCALFVGFQKWGYERLARYLEQPYASWVNSREDHSFHNEASSKYKSVQEDPDFFRYALIPESLKH